MTDTIDKPEPHALQAMRERARPGTRWAAYQNADLGHPDCGRLQFLMVGDGCTFANAPERAPDTRDCGLGWRYVHVGFVDLDNGTVVR